MDLGVWHGPGSRKTLVVLGAGASRGASFVRGAYGARPPLDLDFFSELQRLQQTTQVTNLLQFVREEFGTGLTLSMEEFFSQVEYTHRFHDELNVDPGPKIKRYQKALELFYESLPVLFKQAIGNERCEYHQRLVKHLYTDDVVISFNYDCVIDTALRDHAGRRWDPDKRGYGFQLQGGGLHWRTEKGKGAPKRSITLLKPHGSLNWRIDNGQVSLEERPYDIESAEDRIVPPTWFKRLDQEPYASVWKRARLEIRRSRALIVVGYSVPSTDLFSRALFKAEVSSKIQREKLDFLVVANPDRSARQRFVDLVSGGIEQSTRILEFDSFEELVGSLQDRKGGGSVVPQGAAP